MTKDVAVGLASVAPETVDFFSEAPRRPTARGRKPLEKTYLNGRSEVWERGIRRERSGGEEEGRSKYPKPVGAGAAVEGVEEEAATGEGAGAAPHALPGFLSLVEC